MTETAPAAIASRFMEIACNSSECIWTPRSRCSWTLWLQPCGMHVAMGSCKAPSLCKTPHHPPSQRNPCVWERKEMCCAPADLLVWITRIATQSRKNICPAIETHLLWYMNEKLWNGESNHCHKHGTRCVSPEAGVALLWKYWLHWLLLLSGNQLRSGSPTTIQDVASWGELGLWKTWTKYWRSLRWWSS